MLYILIFESVGHGETLKFDYSNESLWAAFSSEMQFIALYKMVLAFKSVNEIL